MVLLDRMDGPTGYDVMVLLLGGSGSEVGSYLRLIDSYITQLKAQGPHRTCDESAEGRQAS